MLDTGAKQIACKLQDAGDPPSYMRLLAQAQIPVEIAGRALQHCRNVGEPQRSPAAMPQKVQDGQALMILQRRHTHRAARKPDRD